MLLDLLNDEQAEVKRAAVLALGRLGKANSDVPKILESVGEEQDSHTRQAVAVALALLGKAEEPLIPLLVAAVLSGDDHTADAAVGGLGTLAARMPDALLPVLLKDLANLKGPGLVRILRVLAAAGPSVHQALPKLAGIYGTVPVSARREILSTLGTIDRKGDHALPLLKLGLEDPAPELRRDAIVGLIRYRGRPGDVLGLLVEALNDAAPKNRVLALGILRGMGKNASAALPQVISRTGDSDPEVRTSALSAMIAMTEATDEAVKVCEEKLSDQDDRVKCAAVKALRKMGGSDRDKVVLVLDKALREERQQKIRQCIQSALRQLSQRGDRPPG